MQYYVLKTMAHHVHQYFALLIKSELKNDERIIISLNCGFSCKKSRSISSWGNDWLDFLICSFSKWAKFSLLKLWNDNSSKCMKVNCCYFCTKLEQVCEELLKVLQYIILIVLICILQLCCINYNFTQYNISVDFTIYLRLIFNVSFHFRFDSVLVNFENRFNKKPNTRSSGGI